MSDVLLQWYSTAADLAGQGSPFVMQAVVEAADEAIAAVDQVALAQFVALKNPEEGPEAAKKKKDMTDIKAGLVDAWDKKCRALLALLPKVSHVTVISRLYWHSR